MQGEDRRGTMNLGNNARKNKNLREAKDELVEVARSGGPSSTGVRQCHTQHTEDRAISDLSEGEGFHRSNTPKLKAFKMSKDNTNYTDTTRNTVTTSAGSTVPTPQPIIETQHGKQHNTQGRLTDRDAQSGEPREPIRIMGQMLMTGRPTNEDGTPFGNETWLSRFSRHCQKMEAVGMVFPFFRPSMIYNVGAEDLPDIRNRDVRASTYCLLLHRMPLDELPRNTKNLANICQPELVEISRKFMKRWFLIQKAYNNKPLQLLRQRFEGVRNKLQSSDLFRTLEDDQAAIDTAWETLINIVESSNLRCIEKYLNELADSWWKLTADAIDDAAMKLLNKLEPYFCNSPDNNMVMKMACTLMDRSVDDKLANEFTKRVALEDRNARREAKREEVRGKRDVAMEAIDNAAPDTVDLSNRVLQLTEQTAKQHLDQMRPKQAIQNNRKSKNLPKSSNQPDKQQERKRQKKAAEESNKPRHPLTQQPPRPDESYSTASYSADDSAEASTPNDPHWADQFHERNKRRREHITQTRSEPQDTRRTATGHHNTTTRPRTNWHTDNTRQQHNNNNNNNDNYDNYDSTAPTHTRQQHRQHSQNYQGPTRGTYNRPAPYNQGHNRGNNRYFRSRRRG